MIAAEVGGLPTVVRHGHSGLLVPTHEPRDWAAAIKRVISDPVLQVNLSLGALEQARHFSWEITAERTLEVYEQAQRLMRQEAMVHG